jgi:hypothetical protein
MKTQRIYIDTSVIGGCFDVEFATWSNALFQDFRLGRYYPVVSELLEAEILDAPLQVQDLYAELLISQPELLAITPTALTLASIPTTRHPNAKIL